MVGKSEALAGGAASETVYGYDLAGRLQDVTTDGQLRATYGYDQRLEVHGSKGMIHAKNVHNTTVEVLDGTGYRADPIQNFFLERYGAAYANELDTFIAAVESGNRDPRPNGFDGLQAQKLAEAATQSCKTGQPVKVSGG